jgi:acetyl-CoA C-acetyltransferase
MKVEKFVSMAGKILKIRYLQEWLAEPLRSGGRGSTILVSPRRGALSWGRQNGTPCYDLHPMTTATSRDSTPILIGAGQITQARDEPRPADPLELMVQASQRALEHAGTSARTSAQALPIDAVWVVNIFCWSYKNAPQALAERLGLQPRHTLYTAIGGNNPQRLVNRAARALAAGEVRAVLISGAEAVYSLRRMSKGELLLDWPEAESPEGEEVEAEGPSGLSDLEGHYDLFLPVHMYPLFETALVAHRGLDADAHRRHLGALSARLAAVAAENPHAWSRDEFQGLDEASLAAFLATPGPGNRWTAYPYSLRMNANLNVDQGAAVLMTTVGEARRRGIPPERWVYPQGGGELNEVWHVSRRPHLHRSPALEGAVGLALGQAGVTAEALTAFDFYSCFPCAVEMARQAVGLPEEVGEDPRPLTLTGGLPYFGGPGNNYSLHAIAEAVERVRRNRDERVLVNALGWYLTKHAAGVYGGEPGAGEWSDPGLPQESARRQEAIDAEALPEPVAQVGRAEGEAEMTVEAFVIRHDRSGLPERGTALGRLPGGERVWADFDLDPDGLAALEERGAAAVVGATGTVRYDSEAGKNLLGELEIP